MRGDWIYTGDRFVERDGYYYFQGRADDLVKISGQWVWPLEVERCLNCDIQTVFTDALCIECDACIDICPTQCLTITENGEEEHVRSRLTARPANADQPMFISDQLKQTGRIMVKDENVCVHCGLCAERCPTAAWDMQKSILGIPYAKDHDVMPGGCRKAG